MNIIPKQIKVGLKKKDISEWETVNSRVSEKWPNLKPKKKKIDV